LPVLLRGTWHGVLRIVANSKNAGPHSVVCLLFSFQRPSTCLGFEILPSNPSLSVAGVAKTTVLLQVGGVDLLPLPCCVKKSSPKLHRFASRLRGVDFYINVPIPVKRAAGPLARSGLPSSVGAASTPTQEPRQEEKPAKPAACSGPSSVPGALLLPPRDDPVKSWTG